MNKPLLITVIGKPAPQGSKRFVGNGRMIESSKRVKPWREAVKEAALDALELCASQTYGDPAAAVLLRLDGPVAVEIAFCFDKPKSAPKRRRTWPVTRSSGDLDKNIRACFDALTEAGAFRDDSQVVTVLAHKYFTDDPGAPLSIPGAVIAVQEVTA